MRKALLAVSLGTTCASAERDCIRPVEAALADRRVALMPLMLVAGGHAHGELAGDGPDSWKSILEARGFDVRVRMQGLGALAEVQRRFVEKARALRAN